MDTETSDMLKTIYFNPGHPGSFTSALSLKRILKKIYNKVIPLKHIEEWLKNQRPHYMHKPAPQTFSRNPIFASRVDEQWQADLLFLPDLAPFNQKISIHIVVIDVLSRFAWIEPLPNKTGKECSRAFEAILARAGPRKPESLQTDDGKEFFNSHFHQLMVKYDIEHFSSSSDLKAAIAERFIKTIKEKIYKYLAIAPASNEYLSALQDLVRSYNNTYHSSIGMTPASVSNCTAGKAVWNLYHHVWAKDRGHKRKPRELQFNVGDFVRISSRKQPLSKRYKGNWTEEIFKIDKIKSSAPERMYKLVDLRGEPVKGGFYSPELQRARAPSSSDNWHIERVIKERKIYKTLRGRRTISHKEYYVSWFGYPDSFNEWIHENQLQNASYPSESSQ